jgi:16S rRNA G966 N2-methylase RsmD
VDVAEQLSLEPLTASPSGMRARRSGALYGVHAYHTKVPPEAIVECIEAHTQPGDLVLDPFCGSGMTGVAASMSGRRAVLNDLSPAAVHIASNYVAPCDPARFAKAVDRVLAEVGEAVAAMYATSHAGGSAVVEYVVWSDIRACRHCQAEHLLWDFREAGLRKIVCASCGTPQAKSEMRLVGEAPVETNLSVAGRKRVTRFPTEQDLGRHSIPAALPWVPSVPFDADRPMWRRGHQDLGIKTAADFYSARNLAAMSLLWDSASRETDTRVRNALRFSLTAIANRASRRYQWNAKRPTNVLSGTLYVSSLRYEWNVLSLWRRKVAAVARLFTQNHAVDGAVRVLQGSATALPLEDESVDYCFTDPPFGAHIVYSDASLLWEA